MRSYTNARPGVGLLVLDLDRSTASGLLASRKFCDALERLLVVDDELPPKRTASASFLPRSCR